MKYLLIITLLVFLIIGMTEPMSAQEVNTDAMQSDNMELNIPPLSVILDSAIATNAMVRFRDQGIIGKQSNLTSYKNYWTRNLGVQADVRYGTFNNFSTNTAEGQSPSVFATNTTQTVYGVGIYLKLPLQDVLNRKNQITMARSELDQARSMAEAQREEIRHEIIRQYNEVILKQHILTIKAKNLSASRVNMDMAIKQFQNGVVSVTEYTRISDIVADVESEFETAKADFITSYMILEEMAGFKFN
jgi:outer membrane protein TolC